MADPVLQLQPDHLRELLRLVAVHLPHEEVWAYGSRVNGTALATSDLDLVVRHAEDLDIRQGPGLAELQEALSESNLPFLVDLLDWAALRPSFRDRILAQYVPLYPSKTNDASVRQEKIDSRAASRSAP